MLCLRWVAMAPTTARATAATANSTHTQAGRLLDPGELAGVAVVVTVVGVVVVVVDDEVFAFDATTAPAAPAATAAPLWWDAVDVLVSVLVFVFVLVTVFVLVLVLVTVFVCEDVVFVLVAVAVEVVVVALAEAALAVVELVPGAELDVVVRVSEAVAVWLRLGAVAPAALSDWEMLEATVWLPPEPQPPVNSAHAPITAVAATRCLPPRRTTYRGSNLAGILASTGHTRLAVVVAPG